MFFRNCSQNLKLERKSEISQRTLNLTAGFGMKVLNRKKHTNISQRWRFSQTAHLFNISVYAWCHTVSISWTVLCWSHLCYSFINTMKPQKGTACFSGRWQPFSNRSLCSLLILRSFLSTQASYAHKWIAVVYSMLHEMRAVIWAAICPFYGHLWATQCKPPCNLKPLQQNYIKV